MGGVDVGGGGGGKRAVDSDQYDPVHRSADGHHRLLVDYGCLGSYSRINANAQVPRTPARKSPPRPRKVLHLTSVSQNSVGVETGAAVSETGGRC